MYMVVVSRVVMHGWGCRVPFEVILRMGVHEIFIAPTTTPLVKCSLARSVLHFMQPHYLKGAIVGFERTTVCGPKKN